MLSFAVALLLAATTPAAAPSPSSAAPPPLTVFLDIVVEDLKGRPARNLVPDEVFVMQDGERQKIATLEARDPAGRYEMSYVPRSGKAGAVIVRLVRPGTRVRGANGPGLVPRVVAGASPLETELAQLMATRPDANDFPLRSAAYRFGPRTTGVQHSLAVEVPMATLPHAQSGGELVCRVQFLAVLKDAQDRVLHRFNVDRSVSAHSREGLASQRLVWTTSVKLPQGRYTLDVIARDGAASVASFRHLGFETAAASGLRLSHVALLQPVGGLVVRDQNADPDDPLVWNGASLAPMLDWRSPAGVAASVPFLVIVYPDPTIAEATTLRLKLLHDGQLLGTTPVPLSPADARGEIRCGAELPIRGLAPGDYAIRLEATQGEATAAETASFSVTPHLADR